MASLGEKIKGLVWARVAGAVTVVVLVVVIVFLNATIQGVRREIYIAKEMINHGLGNLAKQSALRAELEKRSHDLDRISSFVLERESVGDYIGVLEAEASRLGLTLRVPEVSEEQSFDANGQLIEQSGIFEKVRIKVQVTGNPSKLLNFLSAVEHEAYLSGVVGWKMLAESGMVTSGISPTTLRATSLSGPGGVGEKELVREPQGRMEMDVLLSILNEDASKLKEGVSSK